MTADDLQAGMMVTVLDWAENQGPRDQSVGWNDHPLSYLGMGSATKPRRSDHMGEVLQIAAVSLPYVAVVVGFTERVVTLDVRKVELTRITDEYVAVKRAAYESGKGKHDPYPIANLYPTSLKHI